MFVVLFEVQPKPEQFNHYLELARLLRPELECIDGFIDNERYKSTSRSGVILSLSTWRDEKALIRWRTQALHHQVQEKGRFLVFLNYRLRIGEVTYDTNPPAGQLVRQQRFDETEAAITRAVTVAEILPTVNSETVLQDREALLTVKATQGFVESEVFESITNPGKELVMTGWQDTQSASTLRNTENVQQAQQDKRLRYREVRIIRAYGMFDRTEAPQYYPEVQSSFPSLSLLD